MLGFCWVPRFEVGWITHEVQGMLKVEVIGHEGNSTFLEVQGVSQSIRLLDAKQTLKFECFCTSLVLLIAFARYV